MEKVVFVLDVNTGNSVKDLQAADKALNSFNKNLDEAQKTASEGIGDTVSQRFQDLKKRIDEGGMSLRDMAKATKELTDIAAAAGRTSPIGKQAIAEAAALKDRVSDLRAEINRSANDGKQLQAALQLGSTVMAGFGAAQGAMALLGNESEDLTKTLVKLQAAQAVVNSLESIRAALEKESFLMIQAKATAMKMLTGVNMAYATAVGSSTGALKIFRIALMSTGIGALIVAIGLLIANFDKVRNAVELAGKKLVQAYHWFKDLGVGAKIAAMIIGGPLVAALFGVMYALEKLGVVQSKEDMAREKAHREEMARRKKEYEAIQQRIEQANKMIDIIRKEREVVQDRYQKEIDLIEAVGGDSFAKRQEMLHNLVESLNAELEQVKKRYEAEMELHQRLLSGKASADEIYNATFKNEWGSSGRRVRETKQTMAELEKTISDTEHKITVDTLRENKKRSDAAKALADERKKQMEKEYEERKKAAETLQYAETLTMMSARKRREEEAKAEMEAVEAYRNSWQERNQIASTGLQSTAHLLQQYANYEISVRKNTMLEVLRMKKEEIDRGLELTKMGMEAMASMAELFLNGDRKRAKVAFELQKAANASIATIDGLRAVQSVFAQTPGGLAAKTIAATFAGIKAAATVAKILQAKFGDTSVASMAGSGLSSFSGGGGSGENRGEPNRTATAPLVNNNGGNPVVSVIEIMTTAEKVTKVNERATI